MSSALRRPARWIAYGLFTLLDHGVWLIVHLLPGNTLLDLARRRPWRRWRRPLSPAMQQRCLPWIRWLLRIRCHRARWGSSCLSRSLSGRLLLDLAGIANELHLGMSQFGDGRKVPHAWLRDPSSGELLTPGLAPGAGAPLIHF